MILIIPSIDLEQGHCARCIKGEPGTEKMYSTYQDQPIELARLWRRENAKTIHISDKDGLQRADNRYNAEVILDITRAVDIPIQLLSWFPTVEDCEFWLEHGVYRVILNELQYSDPEGVERLVRKYTPSRVVLGIRADQGRVVFPSLKVNLSDTEVALHAKDLGIMRVTYTDISWEGSLAGPDFSMLMRIAKETKMRITEAGGISSPSDLWHLQEMQRDGIDSAIVGRALYENRFPCQKIWRLVEAELEPGLAEHELSVAEPTSSLYLLHAKV